MSSKEKSSDNLTHESSTQRSEAARSKASSWSDRLRGLLLAAFVIVAQQLFVRLTASSWRVNLAVFLLLGVWALLFTIAPKPSRTAVMTTTAATALAVTVFGVFVWLGSGPGPRLPEGSVQNGHCDPAYEGACVSRDVDCVDVQKQNFRSVGVDPHHLDADGDDIACEA